VTYFSGGLNDSDIARFIHRNLVEDNQPDIDLADAAFQLGVKVQQDPTRLRDKGSLIKMNICDFSSRRVLEWPR